ncbi:ArsR/SmtB family transcription factor [Minwuia sp.]|uniref:ArsR/SmtB family transcription factor n=1 Tax=Minwuia sp. TaxID=2493630 RepID=UPI003A8EFFA1
MTDAEFHAEDLVEMLKAAGEPTRLHLLLLCRRCDLSVSELTWILGQSQPRISRHLKLLCDAGLLERYSEGNWVMYRHSLATGMGRLGNLIDDLIDTRSEPTISYLDRLDQIRLKRNARVQDFFSLHAGEWSEISRLQVSERQVETVLHGILGSAPVGDYLDLGTGTGRMLAILGAKASRAIGVDVNGEMLAVARQAIDRPDFRHVHVRQADIHNLPFSRESFDLITAHQVLHFLDDPDQVIREAARVLRPGGRMIVADLLPHGFEHLKTEQAHRRLGFSDAEINDWMSAAGLVPATCIKLTGRPLPVGVWSAGKPFSKQEKQT